LKIEDLHNQKKEINELIKKVRPVKEEEGEYIEERKPRF